MTPLYPLQVAAAHKAILALEHYKGFYLAHDPGCGKTLTAILIARYARAERIVVLTPVIGIGVWQREVAKWWPEAGVSVKLDRHVCNQVGSDSDDAVVWVANYEWVSGRRGASRLKALEDWKPDLLILDEGHYAKSPSSQRSRAAKRLADASTRVLMLSGTPAHNHLDWWAQYRLLDPGNPFWNRSYTRYKNEIGVPHPTVQFAIKGFRPEVVTRAMAAMEPVTHVASVRELPIETPIETPITFPLSREERRVYKEMESDLYAELDDGSVSTAPIVLTKLLRLHQITGGWVTNQREQMTPVGTSKLDACMELINQRPKQKIVVACRFTAEIEALRSALYEADRSVLVIDGRTPQQERAEAERIFQESPGPVVMLLQYRAGGMAITLTRADTLILYSFEPSVIALRQMLGRVWRIGTDHAVQVLPLLAEGTIDEGLWAGLKAGADGVDLVRWLRKETGHGAQEETP